MTENSSDKRPRTAAHRAVAAVALLFAILGIANLGRAVIAIAYASRLPDLRMTVTWPYLAARGTVWGITFALSTIGLLRLKPWGRWTALVGSTLYQVHAWIDRMAFDASDYARQTRPRDLALTVLFLVVVWGILNWPSVGRLFRRQET